MVPSRKLKSKTPTNHLHIVHGTLHVHNRNTMPSSCRRSFLALHSNTSLVFPFYCCSFMCFQPDSEKNKYVQYRNHLVCSYSSETCKNFFFFRQRKKNWINYIQSNVVPWNHDRTMEIQLNIVKTSFFVSCLQSIVIWILYKQVLLELVVGMYF